VGRLPIRSAWLLVVATSLCSVAAAPAQRTFIYTNDNATPNTVSAFSVSTSGALSPLAGSPFQTNGNSLGGGLPAADHIVTVGDRLYVTNTASRTIGAFAIDPSTGTLSPIGAPFLIGFFSTVLYEYHAPRSLLQSVGVTLVALGLLAGGILIFAIEGAICILMAAPIAIPFSPVSTLASRAGGGWAARAAASSA